MKKTLYVLVIALVIALPCRSQNSPDPISVENFNQWIMLAGEYRAPNAPRWGYYLETHLRIANWGNAWQQWLLRPAIHYNFDDQWQLSLGYTWIENFPYGAQAIPHRSPEHNIWKQVLYKQRFSAISLSHRLRSEQRFIGILRHPQTEIWEIDHFKYAHRIRYRLSLVIPIKIGRGKYSIKTFNEAFWDIPRSKGGDYFNQNWTYLGLAKKIDPNSSISLGYQYQWFRKSDGIRVEHNQIIQFGWKFKLAKEKV